MFARILEFGSFAINIAPDNDAMQSDFSGDMSAAEEKVAGNSSSVT